MRRLAGWLVVAAMAIALAAPVFAQPGPRPHGPGAAKGMPPTGPVGRPGGLSPEERRQLRRDIQNHGRDFYPPRSGPAGYGPPPGYAPPPGPPPGGYRVRDR
jgi:hypothetical protein